MLWTAQVNIFAITGVKKPSDALFHCLSHNGSYVYFVCVTHCGLVIPYGARNIRQHLFRWWLVPCKEPRHYLNQFWCNKNSTRRNKRQEHAWFEYPVCAMRAILLIFQCVPCKYFLLWLSFIIWISYYDFTNAYQYGLGFLTSSCRRQY